MSVEYGYFVQTRAELDFGDHGNEAVLKTRLDYIDTMAHMHTAYPGLITDGRSGRIGYYLIGTPFSTVHLRSALLHDWHCARGAMLDPVDRRVVRAGADMLFHECLIHSGVGSTKARLMYWAVRLHAFAHRSDRPRDWRRDFVSRDAALEGSLDAIKAYAWFHCK